MAKVKETTPLEAAQEELTSLRERLARSHRNKKKFNEELEGLWNQRTSPQAITGPEIQRRCVELKSLLEDELQVGEALKLKIEERQRDLQQLTQAKQKEEANALVGVAVEGFPDVMSAFADSVLMAQKWLEKAEEAHRQYGICHPGHGSINMKLRPKIEAVDFLLRYIENGKRA